MEFTKVLEVKLDQSEMTKIIVAAVLAKRADIEPETAYHFQFLYEDNGVVSGAHIVFK